MHPKQVIALAGLLGLLAAGGRMGAADDASVLPGTQALAPANDPSAKMVAGIDAFLTRETERARTNRGAFWRRDCASPEAYAKSVAPNRESLRRMIGAVDARVPVRMETVQEVNGDSAEAFAASYSATRVRWSVLDGVTGEGLLLRPRRGPAALVVAVPDADHTPEMVAGLQPGLPTERQFARRLVENGCLVLVPALIDRKDTWSGNKRLNRFTNQPHREWIYRQAFEMGRHPIGCEVQKILAAADWLASGRWRSPQESAGVPLKIGVAGHGEGGLLALYSAALDTRIDCALVSGYFDARERLCDEPIYRNVFGLLREFGDAEIASLISPRQLLVEHSAAAKIDGPPPKREGRSGAAPGRIATPDFLSVEAEVGRANELTRDLKGRRAVELVYGAEGMTVPSGSERALVTFLETLGVSLRQLEPSTPTPPLQVTADQLDERQRRQVEELTAFTQGLLRRSESIRDARTWTHLKETPDDRWAEVCRTNRTCLWEDVIGRFPEADRPPQPRTRKLFERPGWAGYEVTLEVWQDVFCWGYLLLPRDLKPGERRPVVVCQHGLEGLPEDVVADDPKSPGFGPYQAYAARLADCGFIVYAPHNPYRGGDKFRALQRKANPLGRSLFSIVVAQHAVHLDWLASLPWVDPERIAFYGLSYGGKTAMRVPALLERYCLSICSADFNEWILKNVTVDSGYSYMFTGEYEMPEWNLGHTFNYAEMTALIAPRPFMVERGHFDGVAPDTWVAYEYAKVRRLYALLGLPDRTEIEFFKGPHRIQGAGTFQFLHKHLNWPPPK